MFKIVALFLAVTTAHAGMMFPFSLFSAGTQYISATCSGGTQTDDGSFHVCTINSSGNFVVNSVPAGKTIAYVLQAGGGGSGGCASSNPGGGGAAGGYKASTAYTVTTGTKAVVIGAAGSAGSSAPGVGGNGGDSTFDGITSTGGGGGGAGICGNGANGGSGGGGGQCFPAGTSTAGTGMAGQGFDGRSGRSSPPGYEPGGGGGGGGVAPLQDFTNDIDPGGPGVVNNISGTNVTYALGGAGRTNVAVTANTGDGANGCNSPGAGNPGATGVFIARWQFQP